MLIALMILVGCKDDGGSGNDDTSVTTDDSSATDDSATDDSGADDSGADDTAPVGDADATLTGSVTVSLFTTDEDGDRESVSWADSACGEAFPFGKIFVTAYYEDDDGKDQYVGEYTIDAPTTGANEYAIPVTVPGGNEVNVYASLDRQGDRIVGSDDPVGTYAQGVAVSDGDVISSLDIDILTENCGEGSGDGGGGGGGGGCNYITVSGTADVAGWDAGEVCVMTLTEDGAGPIHYTWYTPDGEESAYALSSCEAYGDVKLSGVWDSNGNGLADPMDTWGVYAEEPDVDSNPLSIGTSSLPDTRVQIPLGGAQGITLVAFARLSGTVTTEAGDWSEFDSGGTLYVVASKYKVSGDLSVSGLDSSAYAVRAVAHADLTDGGEAFTLAVPANSVTYLYAFYDSDNDGTINEPDEAFATEGKVQTSSGSNGGFELQLTQVQE